MPLKYCSVRKEKEFALPKDQEKYESEYNYFWIIKNGILT